MKHSVDVAIIGAGPAGLEACRTAAEAGLQTVIIDSSPSLGGQYFRATLPDEQTGSKKQVQLQRQKLLEKIAALPVTTYLNTLVWGAFPNEDGSWLIALHGKDTPNTISTKTIIIATGAYDLPLPFPGWTLPGVITAGAAQILLKQHALPGRRVVIAGSGPLQLALSAGFIQAGIKPVTVLEAGKISKKGLKHLLAAWGQWSRLSEGFNYLSTMLFTGIPYKQGWSITAAHGQEALESVEISRLDQDGLPLPGSQKIISTDTLVVGYGLLPNNGLARLLGCQGSYTSGSGFIPQRDKHLQSSQPGVYIAGDAAGIGGAQLSRYEGILAALAVAKQVGYLDEQQFKFQAEKLEKHLSAQRHFAILLKEFFHVGEGLFKFAKDGTIICRCEEITLGEIREAIAAGARSPNEIKLLTRSGMGNCQGRMCENYLVELLRTELQTDFPGNFALRPPLHPLSVEVLAGYAKFQ